jgi:hypothetical protein
LWLLYSFALLKYYLYYCVYWFHHLVRVL